MRHATVSTDRTEQTAGVWIDELCVELADDDRAYAYRVLTAVLHALRDGVSVADATRLSAEMPEPARSIFCENRSPSTTSAHRCDPVMLLGRVGHETGLQGGTETFFAVAAVMRVLRHHVSASELDHLVECFRHAFESDPTDQPSDR